MRDRPVIELDDLKVCFAAITEPFFYLQRANKGLSLQLEIEPACMASFTVKISIGSANSNGFTETENDTFTYASSVDEDGEIVPTNNETGINGLTLEDDNGGGSETGAATMNGQTSTDSLVNAEKVYTIQDEVTGQVFEVVSLQIEMGDAAGFCIVSEVPPVA